MCNNHSSNSRKNSPQSEVWNELTNKCKSQFTLAHPMLRKNSLLCRKASWLFHQNSKSKIIVGQILRDF